MGYFVEAKKDGSSGLRIAVRIEEIEAVSENVGGSVGIRTRLGGTFEVFGLTFRETMAAIAAEG